MNILGTRRLRADFLLGLGALLALLLAQGAAAPVAPELHRRPRLSLEADAPGGVCELGETVIFTAHIRNTSREELRGVLRWELETVAFEAPVIEPIAFVIAGKETGIYEYELEMEVAGFVRMECTVSEEGEERQVRRRRRICCAPTEVRSELTRRSDFDEFWAGSMAELKAVEPRYELSEGSTDESTGVRLYSILMHSFGEVRVRGWLQVPPGDGPHPALLRVPGYMQTMRPVDDTGGSVVLSLNIRGQGNSTDDTPGRPADFWIRGLDDKDTYYYRGAFLDCVRGVDYLSSRADVDPERIAVWGMSQGGGLAFATAALDERIDLCIADIPWLCDWVNYDKLIGRDDDMNAWLDAKESRTPESVLATLSYFDSLNFCGQIQCPTLMGVGLQDPICPPCTSFAAFNQITAPHEFRIYEDRGHGLSGPHYEWVIGEMLERFGPKGS
jgi:cephalosporin-C deacetylase